MRKKNCDHFFDNVMWYLVYLLPLILLLFVSIRTGSLLSLSDVMAGFGLGIFTNNPIFTALDSLFGSTGVMPLFLSSDILLYFTWFVSAWLCHLAVDVLLFLVRYAHHLMDCFGGDK